MFGPCRLRRAERYSLGLVWRQSDLRMSEVLHARDRGSALEDSRSTVLHAFAPLSGPEDLSHHYYRSIEELKYPPKEQGHRRRDAPKHTFIYTWELISNPLPVFESGGRCSCTESSLLRSVQS